MVITVHNWFTAYSVGIYQAAQAEGGGWNKFPEPLVTIRAGETAEVTVQYNGLYVSWWLPGSGETGFGYVLMRDGLTELDIFDISAGKMPHATYASWRVLFASH